MIDVTLLGTAALMPLPHRYLSSCVLTHNGRLILFDCGEGTQVAAINAKVGIYFVDVIALTHFHGDHILGLPGLLQSMTMNHRTQTLYITGPKGLKEAMKPILELTHDFLSFDVVLLENKEEIQMHDIYPAWSKHARLVAFKTDHTIDSVGYSFLLERPGKFLVEKAKANNIPIHLWKHLQNEEDVEYEGQYYYSKDVIGKQRKGLKFIYSGDTRMCESLIQACKDSDLAILEGTYSQDNMLELANERGHMTFSQAAIVASKAHVKQLVLTHFSPRITHPEEELYNARRYFRNVVCGYDGMHIHLQYENNRD